MPTGNYSIDLAVTRGTVSCMTYKLEHCDDVVRFTFWFGLRGRFCKDAVYIA